MNPVTMISILNQSSLISDESCAKIAIAIGRQLAADVAPEYGTTPAVEFVPKGQEATKDSCPCYVIDEPDVQGALGYHDTDDKGNPFIKVFCQPIYDNGGTDFMGSISVSGTISHEILEMVGDPDANLWADGPDGNDYAFELCDAVESDCYDVELEDGTKVSVSNFVLKSFFNPKLKRGAGIRFDHMTKLQGPFQMDEGGYQIRRTEPGRVGQVFGRVRGTVLIDQGVVMVFGNNYPSWKRPYKMRKAYKRAATKQWRTKAEVVVPSPRTQMGGAKPPPYDFQQPAQPQVKSPVPVKTFAAPVTVPHKPAFSAKTPQVAKQLPPWLEKIAVKPPSLEHGMMQDDAESLLAGSGSQKYDSPGVTDWLDDGEPDYKPRETVRPLKTAAAKPAEKPLPEWLAKVAVPQGRK